MKIIGHRGARALAPENTLASFDKALEYGVDAIELDVRVTKDGLPALIHDRILVDPSGNEVEVNQLTFKELAKHKPGLITLDQAIAHIKKQVPIIIEVKPEVPTKQTIEIVQNFLKKGWQTSDFLFTSYDQAVLLALHNAFPGIETIVIENWSSIRARRRMKELGTKNVSMLDYWLWSGFIRAMKHGDYNLYSFPPKRDDRLLANIFLGERTNKPAKARRWERYGLAGVITDYPDRFES